MEHETTSGRTAFAGSRPRSAPRAVRGLLLAGAGPALWFAHLNASYLLVPPSCRWHHLWAFAAATVLALGGIGVASLRSWTLWREQPEDPAIPARLLGVAGVVLGALFALATLLVGASALVVDPCL